MADVRPFRGYRPTAGEVKQIAAPPYDVLDSEEARAMAQGNPLSYLHVNKAEIDLPPGSDPYAPAVYEAAANNLRKLIVQGHLRQDASRCFYIYQQRMGDHVQAGLMGAVSVLEYQRNFIKKHELTRQDKEDDRTRHIDVANANTEPVFLTYRADADVNRLVDAVRAEPPWCDFVADDGIGHTVWVVSDEKVIRALQQRFATIATLYVADGHHRSAASARVGARRRAANPLHLGEEPYNHFLAVLFPDEQLQILDYNRVIADLRGMTGEQFVARLAEKFDVQPAASARPDRVHEFGLYLDGCWRRLTARPGTFPERDPVKGLDVQILSDNVLAPLLGIADLRTDKRINFVGGIRGMHELERLVNEGRYAAAFAMHPTTVVQLMAIADAGMIMPPKSTWFEPNLRSGIVVRLLED